MAYLANRNVTLRNVGLVTSTLSGSTISVNSVTSGSLGFSTLNGSTVTINTANTRSLGFSTLTGSTMATTAMTTSSLSVTTSTIALGINTQDTYYHPTEGSYLGTWTNSTRSLSLDNVRNIAISSTGDYQLIVHEKTNTLYLSNNAGASWTALGSANGLPSQATTSYQYGSMSSSGQMILLAVYGDYVYLSNNYGVSFTAVNTSTPLLYLPLDGSTADSMSTSTITATGTMTYVPGPITGQALYLLNTAGGTATSYLRGTCSLGTAITITTWFNLQSYPASGNTSTLLSLGGSTNGNVITVYYATNASSQTGLYVRFTNSSSTDVIIGSVSSIPLRKWYHLTVIFQASGTCLAYLNGMRLGSVAGASLIESITTFSLGVNTRSTTSAGNLYIDDFRITNSAVTNFPLTKSLYSHVAVSGNGSSMMIANEFGQLFLSTNSGSTWTWQSSAQTPGKWSSLRLSDNGQYLAAISQPTFSPNAAALSTNTWAKTQRLQYTASSSSTFSASFPAYGAFNNNDSSTWISSAVYTSGSGNYISTTSTTVETIGAISGEWLQLDLTSPHVLDSYTFTCPGANQHPKTYYIVGSNDILTWYPIQYCVGVVNPCTTSYDKCSTALLVNYTGTQEVVASATGSITTTSYSTSDTAFRYYRFIIVTSWGSTEVGYGELHLNYLGGYIVPNQLSNPGASWIDSGVLWKVSASSGNAAGLFSYDINDYWGTAGGLYAAGWSGAYIGSTSTTLDGIGAVLGEWMQLECSVPLIMHSYSFSQAYVSPWTVPNLYYIAGSNDGTTWYPIHYGSMGSAGFNYFAAYRYTTDILVNYTGSQTINGSNAAGGTTTSYVNSTTPYTYFRLIINKTIGSSGLTSLNFGEFTPRFISGQFYSTNSGSTWSNSLLVGDAHSIIKNTTLTSTGSGYRQLPALTTLSYGVTPGDRAFGLTVSTRFTLTATPKTGACLFHAATTTGGSPLTYLAIYLNRNGKLTCVQSNNGTFSPRFTSTTTCAVGTSYHFVWTINGLGGHSIYFNGVKDATTASGILLVNTYPYVYLGKSNASEDAYLDATISDFRIINHEVNEAEVARLSAVVNYGQPAIRALSLSGDGRYSIFGHDNFVGMDSTYLSGFGSSALTTPSLPLPLRATIRSTSVSSDGKWVVIVTSDASNNIYYSSDYGNTFTVSSVGDSGLTSSSIAGDGSRMVVSNSTQIYTLDTDGGWVPQSGISLTNVRQVASSSTGQYRIVAHEKTDTLYMTRDSGNSWSAITPVNGLPATASSYLACDLSASGQYILIAVNGGYLYRSSDYGATFFPIHTALPLVYLPFDGNTIDSEATSTVTVTGSVTYVTGPVMGQAVNISNTAGSTASNRITALCAPGTSFTISGWFNLQTLPSSGNQSILFSLGSSTQTFVRITYANNAALPTTTYTGLVCYVYDSGDTLYMYAYLPTILVNTWYHIQWSFPLSGTSSVHLNGQLIGSGVGRSLLGTIDRMTIGSVGHATVNGLNGYVDDVRLYNSALTSFPLVKYPYTKVAVSGNGSYMMAGNAFGHLFLSSNAGLTWSQQTRASTPGAWTSLRASHSGKYLTAQSQPMIQPGQRGITSNTWTQQGITWTASGSSLLSGSYSYYSAFDTLNDANNFTSAGTYSNGVYGGSVTTVVQGGIGTISGEYLQIQSSVPLVMDAYTIQCAVPGHFQKTYYILGSNDGLSWYPLQYVVLAANPFVNFYDALSTYIQMDYTGTQTVIGVNSTTANTTAYAYTKQAYQYFRMVATSLFPGGTYHEIGEWRINFLGGSGAITPNQGGLSSNTWLQSGVAWRTTASSIYGGNILLPYMAFDNNNGSNNVWATNGGYVANSGAYSGSTSTSIQGIGNVLGEWLQLQTSMPLILQSYTYSVGGNANKLFKTYYIIGSNDETVWYPLQYVSLSTNPFTTSNTVASTHLIMNYTGTQTIQGNQTGSGSTTAYAPYVTQAFTYFRLLCTSVWSEASANLVEIAEFRPFFTAGQYSSTDYGSSWTPTLQTGDAFNVTKNLTVTSAGTGWAQLPAFTPVSTGVTFSIRLNIQSLPPDGATRLFEAALDTSLSQFIYITATSARIFDCIQSGGGVRQLATMWEYNTDYHLVWTIDGSGNWRFYLNGIQDANTNTQEIIVRTYPLFNIGRTANPAINRSANMTVSDFRMFNRALNAAEVQQLYANRNYGQPALGPLSISKSGKYLVGANQANAVVGPSYLTGHQVSSYSNPLLSGINAPIVGTAVSQTGQFMVLVTAGTTNNVYYSRDYGATFTALTVGSSPMVSCAMSYDGSYLTVSNGANIYCLNSNSTGYSLAIGSKAGQVNQSENAIAIGNQAGQVNQSANSIVLNATGSNLETGSSGFYVAPIAGTLGIDTNIELLGYGIDSQVIKTGIIVAPSGNAVMNVYLGIGTTDPRAPLQIHPNTITLGTLGQTLILASPLGNAATRPSLGVGAVNTSIWGGNSLSQTADDGFLRIAAGGGSGATVKSYIDLSGYSTQADMDRNIVFGTQGTERMRIHLNGNIGIGTTNPTYKLHVVGDIYASGNITGLSDRRFKTNVEPLAHALDAVTSLNGYTYFRPDHRPDKRQMGLIAQEVQEVYPEAVTYDQENDRYGVNYNAMIAPLLMAIKEMRAEYHAQIESLQQEISDLKARLA